IIIFQEAGEDCSIRKRSTLNIERHRYYGSAGVEATQRHVVGFKAGNCAPRSSTGSGCNRFKVPWVASAFAKRAQQPTRGVGDWRIGRQAVYSEGQWRAARNQDGQIRRS